MEQILHTRDAFSIAYRVDDFTDALDLVVVERLRELAPGNLCFLTDHRGPLGADPEDVLKRNLDSLLGWNIYACDTRHNGLLITRNGS